MEVFPISPGRAMQRQRFCVCIPALTFWSRPEAATKHIRNEPAGDTANSPEGSSRKIPWFKQPRFSIQPGLIRSFCKSVAELLPGLTRKGKLFTKGGI